MKERRRRTSRLLKKDSKRNRGGEDKIMLLVGNLFQSFGTTTEKALSLMCEELAQWEK